MSNRLQDKVILITGAAQGIGFACARQAAAEGASVILADIQQDRGEKSAAAIGGLLSLTRTLAGALAQDRIRVNYVIPGWVFTEGELAIQRGEGRTEDDLRKAGEKLAFGRSQSPQETAYAVVYLLSDESAQ